METFQALLESQFNWIAREDQMLPVRAKAWDHFMELGLPSKHVENYKYIRLQNFYSQRFAVSEPTSLTLEQVSEAVYPKCKQSHLVFVNGHYQPELSNIEGLPTSLVILPLHEALKTYGAYLNNHWAKSMKQETDPFAVVNAALHQNGTFVYLPPKCVVDMPIQVLHFVDCKEFPMLMLPRLHLFIGAQSQVDLIATHHAVSGSGWCINQLTEMNLEEAARVRFTQMNEHLHENIWHFDAVRATLKRDAWLETVNVTNGSEVVRNDYKVVLQGENAEALLNGLWRTNGKREAHQHVFMEHQAPHCRSFQLFKGVLRDLSRSSFEGKIYVHQEAQKTDAFQLNNNLLLSDRANADSKPNLEIFADDVKASHGATIGQLDEDQVHYMRTRGISEAVAKELLVEGYCQEILEKIGCGQMDK